MNICLIWIWKENIMLMPPEGILLSFLFSFSSCLLEPRGENESFRLVGHDGAIKSRQHNHHHHLLLLLANGHRLKEHRSKAKGVGRLEDPLAHVQRPVFLSLLYSARRTQSEVRWRATIGWLTDVFCFQSAGTIGSFFLSLCSYNGL